MNIVSPKVDMVMHTTPEFYQSYEKYLEQMSLDLNINIDVIDKDTGERIMLIGGRL